MAKNPGPISEPETRLTEDSNSLRRLVPGSVAALRSLAIGVLIGAVAAVVTKAVLTLYAAIVHVVFTWVPETLEVDGSAAPYLFAALGVGGLLVGLGQKFLGYHPEPLEKVTDAVAAGDGVDYRTIPQTMANSLAAIGFGGPVGPEASLVAVIGGIYYWASERMERFALVAYRTLMGRSDGSYSAAWRYAPSVVAVITTVLVFRAIPGGVDLTFVPEYEGPRSGKVLAIALLSGAIAAAGGIATSAVESRVRARRLFDRAPLILGILGGLIVAALAVGSPLVLFSGAEQMQSLFDGSASNAELWYSAGAKWIALIAVFALGWKGGPIFPLMYISGAIGIAAGASLDFGDEALILYAAAIAGSVSGHLKSVVLGVLVALLVVPASMLIILIAAGAGAGLVLRVARHSDRGSEADASPA
jgi:H+/Cl- antiporter ClcA